MLPGAGAPDSQHLVFQMPDIMMPEVDPVLSFARAELGTQHSRLCGDLSAAHIKVLGLSDNCFIDR